MEIDYSHKTYQHIGGQEGILKLIDKDNLEYIATSILEDTVIVLKTMTDPELRTLFNKYFNVEKATDYSTELPKLYMARSTLFTRDVIQNFASVFLKTLPRIPNYTIPKKEKLGQRKSTTCLFLKSNLLHSKSTLSNMALKP